MGAVEGGPRTTLRIKWWTDFAELEADCKDLKPIGFDYSKEPTTKNTFPTSHQLPASTPRYEAIMEHSWMSKAEAAMPSCTKYRMPKHRAQLGKGVHTPSSKWQCPKPCGLQSRCRLPTQKAQSRTCRRRGRYARNDLGDLCYVHRLQ